MGSYLNFSIERKLSSGEWVHFYDLPYDDDLLIVNDRVLRDSFYDTEFYDGTPDINELCDKTKANMCSKIERHGIFCHVDEESDLYPYKFKCFENYYWMYTSCNTKEKILKKLDELDKDLDTKFNDVGILIKDAYLKELFDKNYDIITFDDRSYLHLFMSPHSAKNALLYNPDFQKDYFWGIASLKYLNSKKKEVKQYKLTNNTRVSSYNSLLAMKSDLEKSIKKAELSMSDDARLSQILSDACEEADEDDWNTSLGKIVKSLIKNDNFSYSEEYIDGLKLQLQELEKLIFITGINGRVIWNIS